LVGTKTLPTRVATLLRLLLGVWRDGRNLELPSTEWRARFYSGPEAFEAMAVRMSKTKLSWTTMYTHQVTMINAR
jgi:hypothetical protein